MRTPSVDDSRTIGRVVKYTFRRFRYEDIKKDTDILKCVNGLIRERTSNPTLQNNIDRICGKGE